MGCAWCARHAPACAPACADADWCHARQDYCVVMPSEESQGMPSQYFLLKVCAPPAAAALRASASLMRDAAC